MILYLDIGNTRLKWMLEGYSGALPSNGVSGLRPALEGIKGDIDWRGVSMVAVSSVVGVGVEGALRSWVNENLSAGIFFAEVKDGVAGVKVAYDDIAKFGVDRWLVLLAARRRCRGACVVVDAGSALTVDYLSGDGLHYGGMIIPGVALMVGALFRSTEAVKVELDDLSEMDRYGRNTLECVKVGLSSVYRGVFSRFEAEQVLLTGGDASLLRELFPVAPDVCPDLVFEGLKIAYQECRS